MAVDFYTHLGIPYNATAEEIRNAYFALARSLHPDVNPDPSVRETFLAVQKAFEVLSNPQRKAAYDATLPVQLRKGPEISVTIRYSRSVFPCLQEPQLAYAFVELVCTADLNSRNMPPGHVCLVLDRSTSMQGARMDMVKASAYNLLQQLRPQDMLTIISFSDRAEVLIPPTRVAALSKSDHRIHSVQPGGGTEILQGLAQGMEQLRKTDNTYLRHLILLTDGKTYGDDEGCLQLARDAASEGITISVLGIGHEWNDTLMDQIASISGGNSIYVNSSRELENFLSQKMADLGSLYARGLSFDFKSAPGVQLRYAFRLNPSIGPLEVTSPLPLGDIQYRKSISFLLEFMIPPIPTEVERFSLASGQVWMEIPSLNVQKARLLLDIQRPVKTTIEPEAPPSVLVEAMSKLTLYRLQEKVRLEVDEGQIEKATKHMHYLATHLLSQGDRELAHAVLIEAEHIQQSRRFSGEGEKRIKYGTRSLLLPPGPEPKP
jgi:Ca-activated chloride channel family protein